jgi:hypothetical protein
MRHAINLARECRPLGLWTLGPLGFWASERLSPCVAGLLKLGPVRLSLGFWAPGPLGVLASLWASGAVGQVPVAL